MQDNKDNNQINELGTVPSNESPASDKDQLMNPIPDNNQPPPKKSKKKWIIALIVSLLIVAGSAGAYFLFGKNKQESAAPTTSTGTEAQTAQKTKLFMQLDQKIISYDTATKESSIITDKVPRESKVIDFYYGSDDEWRYYAFDNYDEIYFSDQASDPELVGAKEFKYSAVANAEKRLLAYTVTLALENSTTKTYLSSNNDQPELIYESRQNDFDPDTKISSDPKSFLYVVRDISNSGEELVYQQEPCFECGGIGLKPYANLFKLNLKTKETEVINKSEEGAQLSYFNRDDDVVLVEDKTTGYDTGKLKVDIMAYLLKKDGSRSEIFQLKNDKTLSYSFDNNGDFVVTQLLGDNYPDDETDTLPGALYDLRGDEAEALEAELQKHDYELGNSAGDCVTAGYNNRQLQSDDFTYEYSVGVICKDDSGVYAYNALETIKNSGDLSEDIIYSLL